LSSFLAYNTKRAVHEAAGIELGNLADAIALDEYARLLEVSDGSSNSDEATKPSNTFGEYRKAFKQARTACKASIPAEISSILNQYRDMTNYLVSGKENGKVIDFEHQHFILSTASDTFLATVTKDTCYLWGWPIFIPKDALEKALDNLAYALDTDPESPKVNYETLKKVYFKKKVTWGEIIGPGNDESDPKKDPDSSCCYFFSRPNRRNQEGEEEDGKKKEATTEETPLVP
jgi:hypothetical protein